MDIKAKILQITRQFYPATGGIENVVLNISKELINLGYDVAVLTLDRLFFSHERLPPFEIIENIPVYRIPYFGSHRYAISLSALKFINDFDIIHIHSSDFFLDYLALTKIFHKKKLVLHSHGLFFHTKFATNFKSFHLKTMTRFTCKFVDSVICDSKKDVELLKTIIPSNKINLIPNGININNHIENHKPIRDPNLIISVGRLFKNKRLDLLIKAFSQLSLRYPKLKLVIIGKDQGELLSLQKMVHDLKLENQISFTGEIETDQLIQYLNQAKIWSSASEYESFGIGLLEAMAYGCIPIISDIPAFRELVNHKQNGFLTNFEDIKQTTAIFEEVLNLPNDQLVEIQSNNQLKILDYQWKNIVRKIIDVYESI